MWLQTLIVGLGGFCGAALRYLVGGAVHRLIAGGSFPYGTVTVNLLGCFVLGALMGFVESRQLFGPSMRSFALIGLLGGFTTFSTFGYETFALLRQQQLLLAFANVSLQLVVGVGLVALGYALTTGSALGR